MHPISRRFAIVGVAAMLTLGVTAVALGLDNFDPTTTWNVTPILKTFPDDRDCPSGSTLIQDQFQSVTQGIGEGTATETYTIDGKSVTVNLTIYANNSFDFEVVGGVMPQMFVKASNYLLYRYDPPVAGALNTGPVTYDTALHDGVNPQNEVEYQDVSHLDFCLIPYGDPLTALKTAAGTYDRTVEWTLDKTVDDDSHTGYAGETAGSSTWSVVATKSVTLDNYAVAGSITISNSNAYPVAFSIADVLSDATVANVVCPSYEVPAASGGVDGSVTCTYSASPADGTATLNTATVTSLNPLVQGTMATAPVSFTENLIGYDSGTLSDPRFDYSETISASTTETFPETFTCSADPADYGSDGHYQYTATNLATLNDNIDLSDSETVTVDCYLQPLVPTKDATASYDRTVEWTLDKTVDDDSHSGFAGETAGSSIWSVVATKSVTLDNYAVAGSITISNPAPIAQTFTIGDALNDGTVATVLCPAYTVPAASGGVNGSVTCTYSASPADGTATLNTATVTAAGNQPQTATAPVSFTENLIGYDSGTLSDPRFDYSETISASTTETFPETFTCSADPADYGSDGHYQYTATNLATLNDNIDLSDSETVTVDCYAPIVSKTAAGTYDETHTWIVAKSVTPTSQSGYPGDVLPWTWTVDVSESSVDGNFAITGTITVVNPSPDEAMTVSLADTLDDGTLVTIGSCTDGTLVGSQLTIAAGGTAVCGYAATPLDDSATLNTATATLNGVDFTDTASVSFTANVIDGTATLSDDEIGLNETLTAGDGPWQFTGNDSHTCSTAAADYGADGSYGATVDNTATLQTSITQTDDASTTYTCEAGFLDVQKFTSGVVDPAMDWQFALYIGPDGFGGTQVGSTSTTAGDADGILDFGGPALRPDTTYTVCELGISAGWTSFWQVDVDGDGILDAIVIPYDPNANDDPPEDLGNRCVEVGFDTSIPITIGTNIRFEVDNSYPGGDPRTPGYWKNWNRCTNGGQQYTADANGGWAAGFWLLEDVLDPNIGGGIVWDDILSDSFVFDIDTCELGVSILNAKDFATGKNMNSDPIYTLAKHLFAAQLNFAAGACIPAGDVYNGMTINEVAVAAETLLDKYNFDAIGPGGIAKKDKVDGPLALSLANVLDQYNNGMFCGSDMP